MMSPLSRTSALALRSQRLTARGMGAGMGGGGHANNPTFTFQADWNKNKWKGYLFGFGIWTLGCLIPVKLVSFAQKKAGVEW
mmetsp:Transcript_62001/g.93618  ORF Transcript_62001/g.93618 Transcript_62001/m.93618 type:complete len:82 (-) Transcript_62001:9-254(-)